jgi:NTE family protein
VRLNAPLTPALALGADRVIVIGLNSSVTHARVGGRPDAIDGLAQLLQVVLADQLAGVNETLEEADPAEEHTNHHHGPHRRIPYIYIAPGDRLEIGRLARDIYRRRYTGMSGFMRDKDLALLGRMVNATRTPIHGELLSYLFLAPEFLEALIALGRRDAEVWLTTRHDAGLWQVGRLALDPSRPAPKPVRTASKTARARRQAPRARA